MKLAAQNKEIARLFVYLFNLETKHEVCVFINLSGHVNWFDISITESEDKYNQILYSNRIRYQAQYHMYDDDILKTIDYKELVDDIISDIEEALEDRDNILYKLNKEREQRDREVYEKLKAKFEGEE